MIKYKALLFTEKNDDHVRVWVKGNPSMRMEPGDTLVVHYRVNDECELVRYEPEPEEAI